MGMLCLDAEDCNFENREIARFCAQCGIPLQGALVQGRYEILRLIGREPTTVALEAIDRRRGHGVILRVLRPRQSTVAERETFLQDAELAISLSSQMREPGSIYVTDYGQDGPVAFLVKSELGPYNWLAIGNHLYELAHYNEALSAYEMATTEDELSVEAWSGKGATLLHLGRAEEALLAYDHALSLYPNDPDLWNSRANVLHELQRNDEEMYCYEQALVYDPNYAFVWSGKGMTLVE